MTSRPNSSSIQLEPDRRRSCQRHPVTPYAGRRVKGVVRRTYLRGQKIYEDGQFIGEPMGREPISTAWRACSNAWPMNSLQSFGTSMASWLRRPR